MPREGYWEPEGGWRVRDVRLKELGFSSYDEYLQSPHWLATQKVALTLAQEHCARCHKRRRKGLNVHHRTYKRLGSEWPGDRIVLCKSCHWLTHIQAPLTEEDRMKGILYERDYYDEDELKQRHEEEHKREEEESEREYERWRIEQLLENDGEWQEEWLKHQREFPGR